MTSVTMVSASLLRLRIKEKDPSMYPLSWSTVKNYHNNSFFFGTFRPNQPVLFAVQYRLWEYTLGSFGGDPCL